MKRTKLKPADIAFSKCIRFAANHTCIRCGKYRPPTGTQGSDGLECSHMFSRRHRTIRWCKENADCMCTECHNWYGENPADSGQWIEGLKGSPTVDIVREKKESNIKVSKIEEKEIAAHYRRELRRMEETGDRDFESWQ